MSIKFHPPFRDEEKKPQGPVYLLRLYTVLIEMLETVVELFLFLFLTSFKIRLKQTNSGCHNGVQGKLEISKLIAEYNCPY